MKASLKTALILVPALLVLALNPAGIALAQAAGILLLRRLHMVPAIAPVGPMPAPCKPPWATRSAAMKFGCNPDTQASRWNRHKR